jgi:hypothetical protein
MHDNGTCVLEDQCQCTHNNKFYDKGAVSPTDCSRRCDGKRSWTVTPGIASQPEYECSAFGQGHVETFDGMMYNFDNIGCSYKLVETSDFGVVMTKKKCSNSLELQMCKEVTISLKNENLDIVLMQKTFELRRTGQAAIAYKPGDYHPPCKPLV